MKPFELPPLTLGLDVVSPESSLEKGAVRRASNVVILPDGGFQMRPGFTELTALDGAHSYWKSNATTRVLVAAGDTLYDVGLPEGTLAPIFVGLTPEEPVSYEDVGTDIYFTCRGVMRKIALDATVRVPGVCDLFGDKPTLTATVGGLTPGRYGVAYALVSDIGEESPISGVSWIDLTSGGILLSGIANAADVTHVRLYVTTPGGGDLYHHDTRVWAAQQSITDKTLKKPAERIHKRILPSGNMVRLYNGRLYVVDGKTIYPSDPLGYGVCDVRGGWMTFKRTITMFEPVIGGIFVGMRERSLFLQGAHESFVQIPIAHGALPGIDGGESSTKVEGSLFDPALAPIQDKPVAIWLSEIGLAIGRPDGSVAYPQAGRIKVTGGVSRPLFMQFGGIKQGVFCVDSMVTGTGGATDSIT